MEPTKKEIYKMKIFPKGQVVIPVHLRKKYHIDIGDHVEVISGNDGILLKPLKKENGKISLTDQLFGIFKEYSQKGIMLDKDNISQATELGFVEGWKE